MVEGVSRRIAKDFRDKISTGQWRVGERVPTTRELAASYGVSVNTIQNAFRELEASDLVERRPRLGGFVKGRPGVVANNGNGSTVNSMSRKATTFAVVGPYTDVGYHTEADAWWGYRIIRGLEQELAQANFNVSMFSFVDKDPAALSKVLAKVDQVGERLAGVLVFLGPGMAALLKELDARNIPWVSVNRPKTHAPHNFVAQDSFTAARLVARCMARMGVDRVAFLGDRIAVGRSTGDKYHGFMEGWLEKGKASRNVDYVQCDGYDEVAGYERMKQHVLRYGPPTGVFATGDLLAIGAMRALRELGRDPGRDTHVVGATGLQLAAYAHPPLTVVQSPMEQMGQDAAQMLLTMAREGVRRMIGRYVGTKMVVRESCRIPEMMLDEERRAIADAT